MKRNKKEAGGKGMKALRKITVYLLMIALLAGMMPSPAVKAAKKVTLSSKKMTITVGQKKTLKLRNNKKKVTWSVTSGKGNVTLSAKKKTSVVITGKKKGTAKVQAKVGKKKYVCTVTVRAKQSTNESSNDNTLQDDETSVTEVDFSKKEPGMYNEKGEIESTWKYLVNMEYLGLNETVIEWTSDHIYGVLVLPSEVTGIGEHAFDNCRGLVSIYMQDSVQKLEPYAFSECMGLKNIRLSANLKSIGDNAFLNCQQLVSIKIPDSVLSIGNNAFQDCIGLESIRVGENNSKYDSRDNCNAIIEKQSETLLFGCPNTIIPNGVKSIGDYAFYSQNIKSIKVPNSVTSVGKSAFYNCVELTGVNITEGLISIGEDAFHGCTSIIDFTMPDSVTNIDYGAFSDCTGLTHIVLPNNLEIIDNWVFGGCGGLTSVTIPESVTKIGDNAFSFCSKLSDIGISDSVRSIGDWAFSFCVGLTDVKIPDNVISVGYGAFEQCTGLKNVMISKGVNVIQGETFSGCENLETVIVPDNVSSIGVEAFTDCVNLSIRIPNHITEIGENAFYGVKTVYYSGTASGSPWGAEQILPN